MWIDLSTNSQVYYCVYAHLYVLGQRHNLPGRNRKIISTFRRPESSLRCSNDINQSSTELSISSSDSTSCITSRRRENGQSRLRQTVPNRRHASDALLLFHMKKVVDKTPRKGNLSDLTEYQAKRSSKSVWPWMWFISTQT